MKLQVVILDKDLGYAQKLASVFGVKYRDKLGVYIFSDAASAIQTVTAKKIDVFLANSDFEIDFQNIPKRCGFGYLVEKTDIDTINGYKTVNKFQKVDSIYRQILSIYSDFAGSISEFKSTNNEDCKVIGFASPCGGAGSSTMAASCAVHFASEGKRVFYLNLEQFGGSDSFFSGEGSSCMSDIIYSLKSNKSNLLMKLESCSKQDPSGVFFYSNSKLALDMLEMSAEEMIRLVTQLKISGSYDLIVADCDFGLSPEKLQFFGIFDSLVVTSEGSENSNMKMLRAYNALNILEQNDDISVSKKMFIVYNKFSNKTGKTVDDISITGLGGAPKYEHACNSQIVSQISKFEMFDRII